MRTKRVVFFSVSIVVAALLWAIVQNERSPKASYSEFLQQVQSGQVSRATVIASHSGANQITYSLKNGSHVETVVPADYSDVLDAMQEKMVNVDIRDAQPWMGIVLNASPFLVLLGFWVFMMRRLPGGRGIFGATPDAK